MNEIICHSSLKSPRSHKSVASLPKLIEHKIQCFKTVSTLINGKWYTFLQHTKGFSLKILDWIGALYGSLLLRQNQLNVCSFFIRVRFWEKPVISLHNLACAVVVSMHWSRTDFWKYQPKKLQHGLHRLHCTRSVLGCKFVCSTESTMLHINTKEHPSYTSQVSSHNVQIIYDQCHLIANNIATWKYFLRGIKTARPKHHPPQ